MGFSRKIRKTVVFCPPTSSSKLTKRTSILYYTEILVVNATKESVLIEQQFHETKFSLLFLLWGRGKGCMDCLIVTILDSVRS